MYEQSIRFTEVDGRRVAWATVGEGPPLMLGGWWMSHLELNWRDPLFRAFLQALGEHRTLVRYDSPGYGLSDREGPPLLSVDEEMAAMAAVIDACGAERIDLMPASAGGPIAIAYAAAHPERVARIVLYGSYADGAAIVDPEARESILGVVHQHWGLGSRVLADIFMPTAGSAAREAFVAFQRESGSAELAARSLESIYGFDVSDRLERIAAPTTVLHRREDRAIPFRLGQELAAGIPGAAMVALDGADHFPWIGDVGAVVGAALAGLGVEAEVAAVGAESDNGAGAAEAVPLPAGGASGGPQPETDLSPRELEVLRLVALGHSDREIAEQLVLSPHTVHRHVANIRTKLRLPSRAAAAAQAARLGLL